MDDNQVVASLVRRCVAGDAVAWEEIVERFNRRIFNICYRFTGSQDDAQDLAQEVFIKIYRTLKTYDTDKGSFMTWVATLTRNLLVDHFRKSKQDRVTDSMDEGVTAEEDSITVAARLEDPVLHPTPASRAAKLRKWCKKRSRNSPPSCGRR